MKEANSQQSQPERRELGTDAQFAVCAQLDVELLVYVSFLYLAHNSPNLDPRSARGGGSSVARASHVISRHAGRRPPASRCSESRDIEPWLEVDRVASRFELPKKGAPTSRLPSEVHLHRHLLEP